MEIFGSLWAGFATTLAPGNILIVFLGVVIGTVIGVLPGLGPTASIALLLPATVGMDMISSLIFLAGIYYGAMYGGSTTSILVNIPGEAASVITCIDGYQMARRGRAGLLGHRGLRIVHRRDSGSGGRHADFAFSCGSGSQVRRPGDVRASFIRLYLHWLPGGQIRPSGASHGWHWDCSWASWERMTSTAWTVSPSEPSTSATALAWFLWPWASSVSERFFST